MKNMIWLIKKIWKYKWPVIIALILFASILICYKFIDKPDKPIDNPSTYLISIFLGIIAFSIPFLWNAYQRILDIKAHTKGDRIENILTKELYQKSLRYFEIFIQYPVGVLIFFGLFVVPLLPFYLGGSALVLFFFYFLMLPQIFDIIERLSTTNLNNFLENTNAESEVTRKVFAELWRKEDVLFEKEFSIEPSHIFEYFSKKIDNLIEEDSPTSIYPLIKDFNDSLQNRSIIFPMVYEEVLSKILEWHFKVWKKKHEYLNKADGLKEWTNYDNILETLDSIIKIIEVRALKGNSLFSFFEYFKKHIEEYKEEKIEDKNKRTHRYIESLFRVFYQVFFENIKDAPGKYDIWEHYFPKEWKVTKGNLEDKDNYISRISMSEFSGWAYPIIQEPTADYDAILENVIKNLFLEVDSTVWSGILLFVYTPHDPGNRIKSVIERKWNFGISGRVYSGDMADEKKYEKELQQRKVNASELALLLFEKQFTKENLKEYVEEINKLEYGSQSKEERQRLKLLDIFSKMLNLMDSKS